MKITREQILKVNKECHNDFELSLSALMRGDKNTLNKKIAYSENSYLDVDLYFTERYENYQKILYPTLHLNSFRKDGNFFVSHGIGYFIRMGENVSRRSMKVLQELTKTLTNEKLIEIYEKENKTKRNLFSEI